MIMLLPGLFAMQCDYLSRKDGKILQQCFEELAICSAIARDQAGKIVSQDGPPCFVFYSICIEDADNHIW